MRCLPVAGRRFRQYLRLSGVALLSVAVVGPALAVLGENVASVEVDRASMRGIASVARTDRYSVHEMELPSGTKVREYVSPAGVVFGVAWQGPFMPDLRQLFGTYYEQYSTALAAQRPHRGPVRIEDPQLVVHSGGRMRSFSGSAFLPGMVPQNVSAEEVR